MHIIYDLIFGCNLFRDSGVFVSVVSPFGEDVDHDCQVFAQ